MPRTAVAVEQELRLVRPPGSLRVGQRRCTVGGPCREHGIDDLPAGFDDVQAMEERLVASHRVEEERLVAGDRLRVIGAT